MVLHTSLINTLQYKVRIEGKVEPSRERSSALPTPRFISYWKGAFWSPSTTVVNFTYMQTDCISMGVTPWSYISELYLSHIENKISKTIITKPKIDVRYVDDISISTHSYDEIN